MTFPGTLKWRFITHTRYRHCQITYAGCQKNRMPLTHGIEYKNVVSKFSFQCVRTLLRNVVPP